MSNEYIKANDNFSLALFFNLSHFFVSMYLIGMILTDK